MTYRELKEALNELDEEKLEMTVSILQDGEIYPLKECSGILDDLGFPSWSGGTAWSEDHPLLLI